MVSVKEFNEIMRLAHELKKALAASNSQRLRYDGTIFTAINIILDGLDVSHMDKVRFLHEAMAKYLGR